MNNNGGTQAEEVIDEAGSLSEEGPSVADIATEHGGTVEQTDVGVTITMPDGSEINWDNIEVTTKP